MEKDKTALIFLYVHDIFPLIFRLEVQNMARGSLSTVLEGLNRAKRDLDDVVYRNIDQKYRKQLVELKTTELAVQDLDKYFKVCSLPCSMNMTGQAGYCVIPG